MASLLIIKEIIFCILIVILIVSCKTESKALSRVLIRSKVLVIGGHLIYELSVSYLHDSVCGSLHHLMIS